LGFRNVFIHYFFDVLQHFLIFAVSRRFAEFTLRNTKNGFRKLAAPMGPYVRILIALPFVTGGWCYMVVAFIPFTDDYGNLILQSFISRIFVFLFGLVMLCAAFYIAVPGLVKRKLTDDSVTKVSKQ